jgi:hypothetical protein
LRGDLREIEACGVAEMLLMYSAQNDIVYARDPATVFYHDVPENEQQHWVDDKSTSPSGRKLCSQMRRSKEFMLKGIA